MTISLPATAPAAQARDLAVVGLDRSRPLPELGPLPTVDDEPAR
jgi:hypothetical protein